MKVVFSSRAFTGVLAETTEKIKTETGGLFLGKYDSKTDTWYVIETIDPGPKSVFEVAYFEYDRKYTEHLIRKIANMYAKKLELIGLWHRHPGSFDVFSSTDDETNTKYASMRNEGAISALVNIDPNFRITVYHVAKPCSYSKIEYIVDDESIPKDLRELRTKEQFDIMMRQMLSNRSEETIYHESASFGSFMRSISPYFDEVICDKLLAEPKMDPLAVSDKILDALMEDLIFFSDEVSMEVSLTRRDNHIVMVQEAIEETTRVYFFYSEEDDTVVFEYKGKDYFYSNGYFKKTFARFVSDQREKEKAANAGEKGTVVSDIRQGGIANRIRIMFGGEKQ